MSYLQLSQLYHCEKFCSDPLHQLHLVLVPKHFLLPLSIHINLPKFQPVIPKNNDTKGTKKSIEVVSLTTFSVKARPSGKSTVKIFLSAFTTLQIFVMNHINKYLVKTDVRIERQFKIPLNSRTFLNYSSQYHLG